MELGRHGSFENNESAGFQSKTKKIVSNLYQTFSHILVNHELIFPCMSKIEVNKKTKLMVGISMNIRKCGYMVTWRGYFV